MMAVVVWSRCAQVCTASLLLLLATAVHAQPPRTFIGVGVPHARATIAPVSVAAGRAQLLVTLHVDPGWHVSWRNPGETGLPTRLSWSLPSGVRATRETWPVPVISHTPVGATHTLEGDVPWLVDFVVDGRAPDAGVDRLVSLTMRYGICREVCIPEQVTVQGVLPARGSRVSPVPAALRARLVTDAGPIAARITGGGRTLCIATRPPLRGTAPVEFVADSGTAVDAAVPLVAGAGTTAMVRLPDGARLVAGSRVLFVRGAAAVDGRLDFRRPAPGCATVRRR